MCNDTVSFTQFQKIDVMILRAICSVHTIDVLEFWTVELMIFQIYVGRFDTLSLIGKTFGIAYYGNCKQ